MIYDEYEAYVLQYKKEYGDKTLVLLECGSFFEIYHAGDGLVDIREIGDLLNIQVSRRNKQIQEVNRVNYEMAGFPSHALRKFLHILVQHSYTVVIVSQVTPPPNPKRAVTEIVSPGTFVDPVGLSDSTYLMVLYVEEGENYKTGLPLLTLGMSVMDVSTGNNYTIETTSEQRDLTYPLDEAYRLMMVYRPKEVYLLSGPLRHVSRSQLIDHWELDRFYVHDFLERMDERMLKVAYQNDILKKAFPHTGLLSPIEFAGLERTPVALVSYVKLLQFAHLHKETILQGLKPPMRLEEQETMLLSYNCSQQLDIIHASERKAPCLLNLLNQAKTAMGRRHFRQRLLTPSKKPQAMQETWDRIEQCLHTGSCEAIRKHLAQVYDVERLFRRWAMEILHPMELGHLIASLQHIFELHTVGSPWVEPLSPGATNALHTLLEHVEDMFDMDRLSMYNRDNIDAYMFRRGQHSELDVLVEQHEQLHNRYAHILAQLNGNSDHFRMESSEKEGYYVVTTKKRWEEAKTRMATLRIDKEVLPLSEFSCKVLTSCVKVSHPLLEQWNHEMMHLERKMAKSAFQSYHNFLSSHHSIYSPHIETIARYVAEIDYVSTNAINVLTYRLSKPRVTDAPKSFARMQGLRHLIIEAAQPHLPYVPNDITLGVDHHDGLLLYGINSAGKSSLMKSIGLCIIMAQAGMFVPCTDMEFSPYDHVFTRISSHDDIYKGHSTFTHEILELRNILKRATARSLVIGDELCSGTESVSAVSIVSAGVHTLANRNTSFVFATHLHDLMKIPEVRDLSNVQVYHLSVVYDEKNKKLVYNRKLEKGNGSTMYGIEVCKSLDLDPGFLQLANHIRQSYTGILREISDQKPSRYHASVMVSMCGVCKVQPADEVHHIKQQAHADAQGYIGCHHKNAPHNLIPLCTSCHDRVHHGALQIQGYVQTSQGVELAVMDAASADQPTSNQVIIARYQEAIQRFQKKKDIYAYVQEQCEVSTYKIQKVIQAWQREPKLSEPHAS